MLNKCNEVTTNDTDSINYCCCCFFLLSSRIFTLPMANRVSRHWRTAGLILFRSAHLTLVFIPSAVSTIHVCDRPLWFAIGIMVWNSHGNSMDRTSNDILFIWLCILFVCMSLYLTFDSESATESRNFSNVSGRLNRKTENSNFRLISVLSWCSSSYFLSVQCFTYR